MFIFNIDLRKVLRLAWLWPSALKKPKAKYVYGKIVLPNGTFRNHARLIKESGRVEFVLWKAGEQGHTDDYWHLMGIGWENHFEPYDN